MTPDEIEQKVVLETLWKHVLHVQGMGPKPPPADIIILWAKMNAEYEQR